MSLSYSEEDFEKSILQIYSQLGYKIATGYDIDRDIDNPLYLDEVENSLININPDKPIEAIEIAIEKILDIGIGSLEEKNSKFTDYLQNGVSVSYLENNEEIATLIKLVDFDNVNNNSFYAINQWTVRDVETKRPDIVVFVNGLPLVVVELKSPSREETNVSEAYTQLKNYADKIPSLFTYNAFCVMSDHATSKAGTITADEDRFMEWKTTDGSYENTQFAMFDVLFEGMFEKSRFLDILKNYLFYLKDPTKLVKILGAYHQYFATNKAVLSTEDAIRGNGKAGVFWHTQGSGKSLSMVFYVHKLTEKLNHPTFVVVTDRNDLDDQLFTQFSKASDFLRQTPIQAESRAHLKELLNNRQANGIFFTTMQKFEESNEPLTERDDVIVISDEAHRGQYGLDEKVDLKTGEIKIGAARRIRDALPNATYIGFTGTPIAKKDKNTREVFGNYIDIYDMTQSVEDGSTVPIHYESRVINLNLDDDVLTEIDTKYAELATQSSAYNIEKSKNELSRMETILGSDEVIESLCTDIVNHYENNREFEVTGKAMVVAYSRKIAMKIYEKILELKPEWDEKVKVVMTGSNKDPEEWHEIIGSKSDRYDLAKRFKDDEDPFKIAIVVDMWLTGFDVPSLSTMYIFKPMEGHNLMQAIARVNRVFEGKEGGLIVDYIGISEALKDAMSDYTDRDKKKYGDMDIAKVAYPKFVEKLEICNDLLHGFDYSDFFKDDNLARSKIISKAVNFLEDPAMEEKKEEFLKQAMLLKNSLSLCRSIATEKERLTAAFFEAVRTIITRINKKGQLSTTEINKQINELLKHSIKSEGVINIFSDIQDEVSIFNQEFLNQLVNLEETNTAIKILESLLNDEVKLYKRTNIVKSEEFSDKLKRTMNKYVNGHISNEEVIQQLRILALEMKEEQEKANELDLDTEELAFYDALSKPEVIKDFYQDKELIELTKELTSQLRKSRTIDWRKKKTARARMRKIVKHLLKDYNYPPDEVPQALDTVLKQCELWADNCA